MADGIAPSMPTSHPAGTGVPRVQHAIPSLDGLRGFACLIVVASHSGNLGMIPRIAGAGQLGVMLFFALSGFLMALLYGNDSSNGQNRWWLRFAIRRFFRVYPLYISIVVAGFAIGMVIPWFVYAMGTQELFRHVTLEGTKSVFWTIPVEMRFYLLFPLLSIFAKEMGKYEAVFYGLIAVLFLLADPVAEKYQVWPYAEFFVFGCCAACLYRLYPAHNVVFDVAGVILLMVIVLSIPRISSSLLGIEHRLWKAAWFYAPVVGLTVLSCARASGSLSSCLSANWFRWVGRVSFSLYLVHLPVLHWVRSIIPPKFALVPAVALSLLVAWACYRLLEVPFQQIGRKLEARLTNA